MALQRLRAKLGGKLLQLGRRRFARGYLHGHGLEIGALHSPFPAPRGATVSYVDRLATDELRHHYPELASHDLVPVDIVDDGERLSKVGSSTQDFVIASHVLEHCQDPIGAVSNWIRVLRPGGIALLIVPDKRFTFDRTRQTTPLAHVLRDANRGPEVSRSQHYLEWVEHVDGKAGDEALARARALEEASYSIHFHVWDFDALRELLEHTAGKGTRTDLVDFKRNRSENLALLRRR